MLRFVLTGDPAPMPQGKVVWSKQLQRPIKIQPLEVRWHQTKLRIQADGAMRAEPGRYPLDGPVVVGFAFYRSRPARVPEGAEEYPSQRPDLDNYEECVLDALNPHTDRRTKRSFAGVYHDDAQVVAYLPWPLHGKLYAADPTEARTEVVVLTFAEYLDTATWVPLWESSRSRLRAQLPLFP
jgi:Holliday junction resolvase RusA-like endonuclease